MDDMPPPSLPLTADVKARIEANKERARLRKAARSQEAEALRALSVVHNERLHAIHVMYMFSTSMCKLQVLLYTCPATHVHVYMHHL